MLATAILAGAQTLPVAAPAGTLGDVTGRRCSIALPSADAGLLQAVDRFRSVYATVLAQEVDDTVPWAAIEATGEAWHDAAGALVDIEPTTLEGLEAKAAAAAMAFRAGVGDYTRPERFDIAAETHDRLALSLIEDVLRMLRGAARTPSPAAVSLVQPWLPSGARRWPLAPAETPSLPPGKPYQTYQHPSLSNGLGDAATDARCKRQLEATERLAKAPAHSLAELETKFAAAMVWFEENGAVVLCGEEKDLLRSCLRGLKALNRGAGMSADKLAMADLTDGHANLEAAALLWRGLGVRHETDAQCHGFDNNFWLL